MKLWILIKSVYLSTKQNNMKEYHVTYYIDRGNPTIGTSPLLGGVTLKAISVISAGKIFVEMGLAPEEEIKYIIEL